MATAADSNQMTSTERAEAEGKARRVLADVAALTIASYIAPPIMFVSNLFTRRALGPLLTGTFATLTLVQQYSQLTNLGILQAAERQLPIIRGQNDLERYDRVRRVSLTVAIASGVLTGLGILLYAAIGRAELDRALFRGLLIYAVMAVVVQWGAAYLTFLRCEQRFQYLARINVLFITLTAVGNVVLTYTFGFDGLVVWTLVVAALGGLAYVRANGAVRLGPFHVSREAKALIADGIPMLILAFGHMGVHTIDNIMVLKLLDTEALGQYTLALSAGNIIYGLANSVSQVLYPRVLEDFGRSANSEPVLRLLARPMLMLAAVLPLLVAPLLFFLPVVVRVFIPKFAPGIPAFRIIMTGISLYALLQLPRLCLLSLGKIRALIGWSAFMVAVCVASSYALARFGLEGIALAACVSYFAGFIGLSVHVLAERDDPRSMVAVLAAASAPTLFCAVALIGVETLWSRVPTTLVGEMVRAVAQTSIFIAAYVPMLFLLEPKTGLLRGYVVPLWRRVVPSRP
jgi:O-antigen/teichoic acid export membrane protein